MNTLLPPNIKTVADIVKFPEMLHQPGSIAYMEKMIIGQLVMIVQPQLIIETGVFKGQTTRFLADLIALNQLPTCRIISFDLPPVIEELRQSDPYFASHEEIELLSGHLPETLAKFLDVCEQPVDLAIIDAEHSYKAVTQELQLIHSKLKAGGYIFCHDYREHDPDYAGVKWAVDKFVASHRYQVLPLNPSQWKGQEIIWGAAILRKPMRSQATVKKFYSQLRRIYIPRIVQVLMWTLLKIRKTLKRWENIIKSRKCP